MSRSESEERSKASFDAFLKSRMPASVVAWREGDEPPDYWLDLDGQTFAVDVSILVKRTRSGLRLRDVGDWFARFVDDVERQAITAGVLRGTYVVSMPRPIAGLRHIGPLLAERILKFLASPGAGDVGASYEFHDVDGLGFRVWKSGIDGRSLLCGGPSDAAWEVEAASELADLVATRIAAKAEDLARLVAPKLLVLDEQYHFAEEPMYSRIAMPPRASDFHTIYVRRGVGEGVLLTSRMLGLRGVWDT